ncbi:DUF4177 domain-containing protein [Marivita sp. GX14005]|uniref:DUF4177 domain-containing protein n=1 Tax=Marivita sp. GX14005 TaxID=2942276 RepID=UPI0024B5E16C|nr:DUF4177 domain-containing protein [Marivita sp. GX14005]
MERYEYKVVPAPTRGVKAKTAKTPEARFALCIEQTINDLAVEGWCYQRSDVLPSEERQGLTGTVTHWRTLLVFRRPAEAPAATTDPARREPAMTAPATDTEDAAPA